MVNWRVARRGCGAAGSRRACSSYRCASQSCFCRSALLPADAIRPSASLSACWNVAFSALSFTSFAASAARISFNCAIASSVDAASTCAWSPRSFATRSASSAAFRSALSWTASVLSFSAPVDASAAVRCAARSAAPSSASLRSLSCLASSSAW